MPPCLTLSIIRYGSRAKWGNPEKGVAPSPTPWCSSFWKGSLWVNLYYSCQHYLFIQVNQMFCYISSHFIIVYKTKVMEVLIDGALWRVKFYWKCTSTCAWLLFNQAQAKHLPYQKGLSDLGLSLRLVSPSLKCLDQFYATRSLTIPGLSTSLISFAATLFTQSFLPSRLRL